MPPRLLLLQARLPDDPMREHEHACFVERTGLSPEAIVSHDLREGPPALSALAGFDALSVGGSGAFYVSRSDLPHFEAFLDFLRELVDRGHPTFASCFGYQAMVQALGGEIVHDKENMEVGSFELELTDEGRADDLFGSLPAFRFYGQMGHKDRAVRHPEGVPNLAASRRSPFQALRIPGKPVWATQFHPELDREANVHRYMHYLADYSVAMNGDQRARVLDGFRDSPETSGLLPRFLEIVLE